MDSDRKADRRSFHVYRFDTDADRKPRLQTFELELDGSERMLLDALVRLKAIDPTLSFRRSCREGVCGSDAMNINGKNGLACVTNLRTLPASITLKPLPGLRLRAPEPIGRDVDLAEAIGLDPQQWVGARVHRGSLHERVVLADMDLIDRADIATGVARVSQVKTESTPAPLCTAAHGRYRRGF